MSNFIRHLNYGVIVLERPCKSTEEIPMYEWEFSNGVVIKAPNILTAIERLYKIPIEYHQIYPHLDCQEAFICLRQEVYFEHYDDVEDDDEQYNNEKQEDSGNQTQFANGYFSDGDRTRIWQSVSNDLIVYAPTYDDAIKSIYDLQQFAF